LGIKTTAHGGNKDILMKRKSIFGPDRMLPLKYTELPIGASVIGFNPDLMKTGSWRFSRPVIRPLIPPCNEACPAGVDIRGFVGLFRKGLIEEALETYLYENPFPAICGRVCFHPCETACNRGRYDEAVSINGLENFIGDHHLKNPPCPEENGKKVAIIGSGPAGLSCAYFLIRLGYSVKIFEKAPKPGGLLRYGIPEYRLSKRVLDKEIQKLTAMGIEIQTGKNLDTGMIDSELTKFDALFIATGAHVPIKLNIPGSDVDGVYLGLDFLKAVTMGNIKAFKKKVVVIGGGNTAIDVARTILRLGGRPIIYYRRTREEIPAMESEINDCEGEGIEIQYLTAPVKILSTENEVAGVEFIKNELGELDKSGRRKPAPVQGTNFKIDTDAVILAVGEKTDLSSFSDTLKTEGQLIKTNEFGQSTYNKLFAGGDIVHYKRTVVDAIRTGKRGAIGIDCYLNGLKEKNILKMLRAIATNEQGALSFKQYIQKDFSDVKIDKQVVHFEDLNISYFKHQTRYERQKFPVEKRIKAFKEVRRGFTLKTAQKEANRCSSCGLCNACGNCYIFCSDGCIMFDDNEQIYEIDYNYCKGCGICAEECPRGALDMFQEE
jgi:2-oxoacid:acceptor oxidoreductase delta subunit (pyruvate/2-ketoisovalerate family)